EKIAKGPKGRRFGSDPGRPLGEHPELGGPVVVKSGRYGPYVSHDSVNATLPKDKTPETVTLEEALPLLAARAAQIAAGGGRRPFARGKTAKSGKAAGKAARGATTKPAVLEKSAKQAKEPREARGEAKGKTTRAAAPKKAGPSAQKPIKPVPSKSVPAK